MKVILMQDTPGLGGIGDAVTVKDGYARNFLLPKGIAMEFSAQNIRIMEKKKKESELQIKKKKEEALVLAQKLTSISCTIAVKVIEEDKLFGSVTASDVQKALEAEGVGIDKRNVQLEQPIKKLGVYNIPIKLHPEVIANCKVWVVKE